MSKRKGFTLVEMLVVISVGSTLMMLAIGLVHQSMTLSKAVQSNSARLHATNRFIDQFREDVHTSNNVVCQDSKSLNIEFVDASSSRTKQIRYTSSNNKILREEVLFDDKIRREELVLSEQGFGHFEIDSDERIARLTIEKKSDQKDSEMKDAPPRLDRKVEAAIGRWAVVERKTEDQQ